ncbi:MAG: methylated-DNA--[protein]-cysteine S-methyltransferase [Gemmataceae bacterium]|nr:methylated-DNA--[protein]-cysteine S-methyltransferase [Gemmataceae bacterium]MDW8242945.1 methylated-DNA--[protein]-cysteine S-methyltransferase [Thermogemmata sp.]
MSPLTPGMVASRCLPPTRLRYTRLEWEQTPLLLGISELGLAVVSLATEPSQLIRGRSRPWQTIGWIADDAGLVTWRHAMYQWVQQLQGDFPLPLDVRGTPFQLRVWQLLREIPRGQVCSYATVACRLGQPQAVRAVAQACAANPLALIIPCHRVVRTDGSLGGYRWGQARKRWLLQYEARLAGLPDRTPQKTKANANPLPAAINRIRAETPS